MNILDIGVDIFVLILFVCDGYLTIINKENNSEISRFFKIASKLPFDLKQILSKRVANDIHDLILNDEIEQSISILIDTIKQEK